MMEKIRGKILSLFKPETKIFERLAEHVELTLDAIDKLIKILYVDEVKVDTIVQDIEKLEKIGDEISFKLTQNILKGAVSLTIQNNLIELVNLIDDLLDTIHFLSKDMNRFKKYLRISEVYELGVANHIKDNILHSKKAILALRQLLLEAANNNVQEVVKLRNDIENLEERGDELKDRTMEKLYKNGLNMDPISFILLRSYIFDIDDIEDACEVAADLATIILISLTS
jgi:uncharacterized protein Yka (UPF0111/DUF47 family)